MQMKNQDIDRIAQEEQQIIEGRKKLQAMFDNGQIERADYEKKLTLLNRRFQHLQDQMSDSIADMMFTETDPDAGKSSRDLLVEPGTAEPIEIMEVVRGHTEDKRAVQVKFMYGSDKCKAVMTNDRGVWTFSDKAKGLSKERFLQAVEEDEDALHTFCNEMKRHPADWQKVVTKRHPENFPRPVRDEFGDTNTVPNESPVSDDPTELVLHRVTCGPLPREQARKKLGEDHYYITVSADKGGHLINFEINTDTAKWHAHSSNNSAADHKELIPAFVAVLDRPHNHLYLNRILAAMRKSEDQWKKAVHDTPKAFPQSCHDLFE